MDEAQVIAALAALAQDTRLRIFRLLVEAGPGGTAAGAIAAALGVPAPTLSFHLAQMKHAGLIEARRDSRSLIYAADFARMNALVGYLTENCCGGNAAACAPVCKPAPERRIARRRSA
jgi:ArsR family transcriptional regulator, arsenate/arsenite/antimonite-responsive transcriptional repressor